VIVASILLAFGIQAWWDNRNEREEERRLLTALLKEARGNDEWLSSMRPYYEAKLGAARAIQEAAAQVPIAIAADSLDALIGTLTGTFTPPLERGALDAVLAGGRLDLISDAELRARVAGWERGFRNADAQAEMDVRVDEDVWRTMIMKLASLPQIVAHQSEEVAPGLDLPDGGEAYGKPPIGEWTDHRVLLREREFLNAVQEKRWAYEDARYNHSSFVKPKLDALIQALELWLRG
jgi:hypothetical protein